MNAILSTQAWQMNAVVFDCQSGNLSAQDPMRALLTNGHSVSYVSSWSPPWDFEDRTRVNLGVATVLDVGTHDSEDLILLDWNADRNLDVLSLLPDSMCPIGGTVAQVRELVASFEEQALRTFVLDVFQLNDVFRYFWTCPASIANHHAHPGGLAVHSLEVATAVTQLRALDPKDSGIAVVYALFHDLGKIWSYEEGTLTADARELGHEHIGFERLLPSLQRLRKEWPEGGLVLQGLFAGTRHRDDNRRGRAIGKVVRSLDAFSAERDMENRAHRYRQ